MYDQNSPDSEPYMINAWTMHIKEFGKIKEAAIRPAPFTLLIGDNNSGKSYMMTLLYGLLTLNFSDDCYNFRTDSAAYQNCLQISEHIYENCRLHSKTNYTLQNNDLQLFQQLLNEFLAENKKIFLNKLFNHEMDIGELRIEFPSNTELCFEFTIKPSSSHGKIYIIKSDKFYRSFTNTDRKPDYKLAWNQLAVLLEVMMRHNFNNPIYFPTTRTGFLLTYKDLIRSALQQRFSMDKAAKNLLTKPAADFLSILSGLQADMTFPKDLKMIRFIEEHIISGHIQTSDSLMPDFEYLPDKTQKRLPMYVSSAVVTETAPLLLILKDYPFFGSLMIEEPEISLHPQLQWEMARLLIRLTNSRIPVVITTHSDIILQHVNNMIKAYEMQRKDRFFKETGYEKEDLLSRELTAVYQFDITKDNHTCITKLPCGDFGFEAMTFYQTLKKLNEQIDLIEDEKER